MTVVIYGNKYVGNDPTTRYVKHGSSSKSL